ncbi:uncharacterized protein MYCGRDRAFT_92216 [Zymoseptoria tritici IPO323]|uniref:Uncharacterized protein n=1 Tax=Zymoseptoria tritici (strain CBS 115943 / IPO323) TaxID=336722 RepID=F9X827_ZYMTI|nr:uncharacterized protein MYCGRDRAFT_92216 [Zymoseptoria tritici IPO323]EGP89118.1 hypothetical protein MYCGRDRAFT_92216 [Zymoseptoria tritici IPO323]
MANPTAQQPNLLDSIDDVYDMFHRGQNAAFAEAADDLLDNYPKLNRFHRVQLMALLVRVVDDYQEVDQLYDEALREFRTLKRHFLYNGNDNPNFESHLQKLQVILDGSKTVVDEMAGISSEPADGQDAEMEEDGLEMEEESVEMEDENAAMEEEDGDDTLIPDTFPLPTISLSDLPSSSPNLMADDTLPLSESSQQFQNSTDPTEMSEEPKSDDLPIRPAPHKEGKFGGSMRRRYGKGLLKEKMSIADLRKISGVPPPHDEKDEEGMASE